MSDDFVFLFVLILIFVLIIGILPNFISLSSVFASKQVSGADDKFKIHGVNRGTTLLIPGLGNGVESFNWKYSDPSIRQKIGLDSPKYQTNLQEMIRGNSVSFDPPGYGENKNVKIPDNADDYCKLIRGKLRKLPSVIVGHSIGGRIAVRFAELYGGSVILLDPTPDYVFDTLPDMIAKKQGTPVGDFLQMINRSPQLRRQDWSSTTIVYSADDADPKRNEKIAYYESLNNTLNKSSNTTTIIRLDNATHWVHVSNQKLVANLINEKIK